MRRTNESVGCAACEVLPASLPDAGRLIVAPPRPGTLSRILTALQAAGMPFYEPFPGTVAVTFRDGPHEALEAVAAGLADSEAEETRALLLDEETVPGLHDFLRAEPISRLRERLRGFWLIKLIADNHLVVHFQLIVESHNPEAVFGYECLVRGRGEDGTLISPARLYGAASTADLAVHLDRAARIGAIQAAATHSLTGQIFINFTPNSVYNPAFCLRTTAKAALDAGIQPERIVFEVVESERVRDIAHLVSILDFYRRNGFRVALDDLGAGYSSLNLLVQLRPDYVKLDMGLVRGIDRDPFKATMAAKLLEAASDMGIATIAEGVETDDEWQWLRDHGAVYQQGYRFAAPAAPPPPVQERAVRV